MKHPSRLLAAAWAALVFADARAAERVDAGLPFGLLPLVDQVDCADPNDAHPFAESTPGASEIQTLLGRVCRVLPAGGFAKHFAYRIGRDKGMRAGGAYLLCVDYPEDQARSIFIGNRGAETVLGFASGAALGDWMTSRGESTNPESIAYPLSGSYGTWRTLFFLHERFADIAQPDGAGPRPFGPPDGFWVVVSHARAEDDPGSAGAAVAAIRLFEVPDPARFAARPCPVPDGLPRRHVFWCEESAPGLMAGAGAEERGVSKDERWYEWKLNLMAFLGANTFSMPLLVRGVNQGWDSRAHGGDDWYWQPACTGRWAAVVGLLKDRGVDVLPYYEYAGSRGRASLGGQRRCVSLSGGRTYTHLADCEKADADVTDPETLEDARRLLDATLVRFKDEAKFVGAWFRTRPTHLPTSLSDRCLAEFAAEANGAAPVTREQLRADPALLDRYDRWWFGKREAFLLGLRDFLRANVSPDAVVLFTADPTGPGIALLGPLPRLVTDDPAGWVGRLSASGRAAAKPAAFDDVVRDGAHLAALLTPAPAMGNWDWRHSVPRADPSNYAGVDGAIMTYTFNRLYTVSSPAAFDAFRAGSGLAAVRHAAANEGEAGGKLGRFAACVERAGPYCMAGEARALAYGDPRFLGYLAPASWNRGFPDYVRAFNEAFLSLPALPSRLAPGASSDPDVVVRIIETERHGLYAAAVNVGLRAKSNVELTLPGTGDVVALPSGRRLESQRGKLRLSFQPCQVRALHRPPAGG